MQNHQGVFSVNICAKSMPSITAYQKNHTGNRRTDCSMDAQGHTFKTQGRDLYRFVDVLPDVI